ncbi:alpha/beta hydrolase [bacterium]|nr:alpha/beta hydrolase [bacterium]
MRPFYVLLIFVLCVSACRFTDPKIQTTLNYRLAGEGTRTLVFVHGWCINGSYWNSQADAFKNQYRVLTLDLAGHGRSVVERKDRSIAGYANDVVNLIRQLKLDSVILIGHSMSGNINLLVFDKIPEKVIGFIGIDNLHELGKEQSDTAKAESEAIIRALETNFTKTAPLFANFLFSPTTDSTVRFRVMNDIMTSDTVRAAATLKSLYEESLQESVYSKKLRVPLVLINSDRYPVDDNLLAKNAGSGYKVFFVKGTGHYPMVEAPEEFNERLHEALSFIQNPD